jgi:hypothetical protein
VAMTLALPRSVMPARPYKYAPRSTISPAPSAIVPNQGALLQPVTVQPPKKEKKNYLLISSAALLGVAALVAGAYAWHTHRGEGAVENAARKGGSHGSDGHVHGSDCPPDCGE